LEIICAGAGRPPAGFPFEFSHGGITIGRGSFKKKGRARAEDPFKEIEGHAFFDIEDELRPSRTRGFEDGDQPLEVAFLKQLIR